ncbi:MAG: hypothetical protein ACTSWZ_02805 [Candidatus Heimdallarchaeaceae archaeon]
MKLQPLDLEFDKIMKEFFIKYKGFNEKNWQKFWKDYKKSEIIQDIKLIIDLYKQRLKSACEFWLKYHNIEGLKELYANRLWLKVSIHLDKKEKEELKEFYMNLFDFEGDYVKLRILEYEFNDWLFHLAFKSVLEDSE